MIIDLHKPVAKSKDFGHLQGMLYALAGQPCLKVARSYGGELTLHFGKPVAYEHPKMAEQLHGSWTLGTRASSWELFLADRGLIIATGMPIAGRERADNNLPLPEFEQIATDCLAGKRIEAVRLVSAYAQAWPAFLYGTLPGYWLQLWFTDGSHLLVVPSTEPDEEDPLPDWELFTPYHTYLQCGPGPVWSYERSDVVANHKSDS
jgi:hypothetical protein